MADQPEPSAVPVPIWEPEPTGVHALEDGSESPLQRVDRRMGNVQKGVSVTLQMIQEHSAADVAALKSINDRLASQDEREEKRTKAEADREKVQLDHTIELRAQSRQLDTLVKVMSPRSGQTSASLRAQILKEIEASDAAYRRKRNLKIIALVGAIIIAALGALGGIASIITAAKG